MSLFIPSEFELISQTITVVEVDDLGLENAALGRSYFDQNLIKLQKNTKGYPLTKDQRYKTFYHELAHFFVHSAQFHELNDSDKERFIDMLGDLMYQFEKTKVK